MYGLDEWNEEMTGSRYVTRAANISIEMLDEVKKARRGKYV